MKKLLIVVTLLYVSSSLEAQHTSSKEQLYQKLLQSTNFTSMVAYRQKFLEAQQAAYIRLSDSLKLAKSKLKVSDLHYTYTGNVKEYLQQYTRYKQLLHKELPQINAVDKATYARWVNKYIHENLQ